MLKAKSNFKSRSVANDVEIHVPLPSDVDTPTFKVSLAKLDELISMSVNSDICRERQIFT